MANSHSEVTKSSRHSKSRLVPLAVGIAIIALSLAMASAVDAGFNAAWPSWARALWAFTLIFGILAGIAFVANGFGVVTSESLVRSLSPEEEKRGRILTSTQFFSVYAGTLLVVVASAIWLERTYRIPGETSIIGLGGVLFLLASLNHPWWLFFTFRRLGWFAAIENDIAMRIVLALLGAFLVIGSAMSIA